MTRLHATVKLLSHHSSAFSCQIAWGRRNLSVIGEWHESQIITDRRSKFQARHVPLTDPADIPEIISQFLAQNKSLAKNASHPHMLAWRTGQVSPIEQGQLETTPAYVNVQQGFKDCGEKGAGSRILDVLVSHGAFNKLVIVTRWYGGSPLGSLRFRHIANSSAESLRKGTTNERHVTKRK